MEEEGQDGAVMEVVLLGAGDQRKEAEKESLCSHQKEQELPVLLEEGDRLLGSIEDTFLEEGGRLLGSNKDTFLETRLHRCCCVGGL